jgi:hypothetical protein
MPARPGRAYRPGSLAGNLCLLEPLEGRLLLSGIPQLDPGVALTCGGSAISVPGGYSTPFVVDWNEDGAKDIVVGQSGGRVLLYVNEGTLFRPVFNRFWYVESCWIPIDTGDRSCPRAVGYNNDGKKDLVVGEQDGRIRVYLNTVLEAVPGFNVAFSYVSAGDFRYCAPGGYSTPVLFDWNGEGRKDIICGDGYGDVYFLRNTGSDAIPDFEPAALIPNTSVGSHGGYACPAVVDWNGDGKQDLLVGAGDGTVWYFENSGSPAYPVFTKAGQALMAGGATLDVGDYASPTVADWDIDGVMDLLVGNEAGQVLYYRVKSKPVVSVSATDPTAAETVPGKPANTGQFRVTRTRWDVSGPLVVKFNLVGSTATSGADYAAIALSVTIPAGSTYATIPVTVLDDTIAEGTETVVLNLAADAAYSIGSTGGRATVTILDNEPTVSVTASDTLAAETLPGAKPNHGAFTVTRTGGDLSKDLLVKYNLVGSTATGGDDYAALTGEVTIPADLKIATVPVVVIDDDLWEGKETVVLNLAADAAYSIAPTGARATVTILDNESTVSVTASDALAAEMLPGAKPNHGAFTVTRTGGDLTQPLLVKYSLAASTATNGTDFAVLSGAVTILANAKSAVIPVTVQDDDEGEPTEMVVLALSADVRYKVNAKQQTGTVKIADNEPIVSVRASDALAAETLPGAKPNHGAFTVTRTGGDLTQPLLVKYSLAGSTATNGTDFAALTGEVTILANAKSAVIPVTVIDDDEAEPTEMVVLALSMDAKYNINAKQQAGTVKIADNEPIVSITASDPRAAEVAPGKPLDLGVFTVTRTGGDLSKALLVLVKCGNGVIALAGTADNGIDFEMLPGELTILAGAKTANILVTPKADGVVDPPETIALTLLADRTYLIVARQGAATVTLTDNIA